MSADLYCPAPNIPRFRLIKVAHGQDGDIKKASEFSLRRFKSRSTHHYACGVCDRYLLWKIRGGYLLQFCVVLDAPALTLSPQLSHTQ